MSLPDMQESFINSAFAAGGQPVPQPPVPY